MLNKHNENITRGFRAHHWSRILDEVENRKLLPIIGPELLKIEVDGKETTFYQHVSNEVMRSLGIDESEEGPITSLADVAYRYRQLHGDPVDVYYQAHDIINARDWPVPSALQKLAEITHFDLFVSVVPDNQIVQALNNVRFGGKATTRVLSYSPQTELSDMPDGYGSAEELVPVVFKLFGDIDMKPDYVITEEDVLKVVHRLQIRDKRPANLFDILRSRSLALLGCSFENWLIRFFFCSAKSEDLFRTRGVGGVIADKSTKLDSFLIPFLDRNRTLLFSGGDAIDFVDELHERWLERNGGREAVISEDVSPVEKSTVTLRSCDQVFISYASEDREAAIRIRDALKNNGVEVWMDLKRLNGGDDFEQKIHDNIRECSVFIPVISRNTLSEGRRFFRQEWNQAIREALKWPSSYPYIQPLSIDDTPENAENLPREFSRLHWSRHQNGHVNDAYVKTLVRVLKRHRQQDNLI